MPSCPYAMLLVNMYDFRKEDADTIAQLLTKEDKEVIKKAIATLENKPNVDRMQVILNQYFRIECEPRSMQEIGASFNKPITRSYVARLRNNAERHMRRALVLRSLVERITQVGIKGRWTD